MVEIEQQAVPERQAMSAEAVFPADEWVERLSMSGPVRDEAIRALQRLSMIRAARHQVARMPEATSLGSVVRDEIINSAADEATIAVLGRLDSFEGRSRFTTWAYKFGILQAGVHVRRTRWRGREVQLRQIVEPVESHVRSPSRCLGGDVASAVSRAMATCLTPHQHKVAVALLVDEVPIDVLSERLGTTRNALYKTLHDVRKRLRVELIAQGHTLMACQRR